MKNNVFTPRFILILTIILFGAIMRLIPHWPNLTPIAAIALFGGAYLSRKYMAFIVTIGAMLISDLVLGFHTSMWAVYLAFALTIFVGFWLSQRKSFGNIVLAALGSSVVFFLITNFAAFLVDPIYPKNFLGLMESYIAGLAFFNDGKYGISFFLNEVMGTLLYSAVFFGAMAFAEKRFPRFATA